MLWFSFLILKDSVRATPASLLGQGRWEKVWRRCEGLSANEITEEGALLRGTSHLCSHVPQQVVNLSKNGTWSHLNLKHWEVEVWQKKKKVTQGNGEDCMEYTELTKPSSLICRVPWLGVEKQLNLPMFLRSGENWRAGGPQGGASRPGQVDLKHQLSWRTRRAR